MAFRKRRTVIARSRQHPIKKHPRRGRCCDVADGLGASTPLGLHGSLPPSGKVRSFLWKLLHRRLNLMCYEHNAIFYGRGDMCPICALSCETEIHLFVECEAAAHLWQAADDQVEAIGCPLPSDPRSRILGAPPSESLCQALLGCLDIPADNPLPRVIPSTFGSGSRGQRCKESQWQPFGTCAALLSSGQLRWQNLSAYPLRPSAMV